MATIALRQIRAVIAVCEEGSFTRAAERENATQSGISQHVAAVERSLGLKLFERSPAGVVATPAGLRYYKRCVEAVGLLASAREEARGLAGFVTGDLRIGLMPTFTRAVLAPTLDYFVPRCPDVRLHIMEGFSGVLTEMVLSDALDFAVVPAFEGRIGLKSRLLLRDREMLLSGTRRGLTPLASVRLRDCAPLKIVIPGTHNIRRRNLETYFHSHGVEIAAMLEMDAMIGTLEFVARSDWVTVLPSVISVNDIDRGELIANPIDPPLHAEFVVIQPARRTLTTQARLFLERLETEVARIHGVWEAAIAEAQRPRAINPNGHGVSGNGTASKSRRHAGVDAAPATRIARQAKSGFR
jgi:LysR family nitrogen assimilation transcriptional regulator